MIIKPLFWLFVLMFLIPVSIKLTHATYMAITNDNLWPIMAGVAVVGFIGLIITGVIYLLDL